VIRSVAIVLYLLVVGGCGSPGGQRATTTVAPTPPSQPAPSPGVASGQTLSGIVIATTPDGTRPLPRARVIAAKLGTCCEWGSVTADEGGRYVVPVPSGDRIRIFAFPPIGSILFQRSVTIPDVNGTAGLDIELVSAETRGIRYGSPTLSGIVYYMTEAGPRTWAHSPVTYSSSQGPWYDAYVKTDEQGRYELGRIPLGPGGIRAGDCSDQALGGASVDIGGDTVVNIDITEGLRGCPASPF
jgi:hypothetical protein